MKAILRAIVRGYLIQLEDAKPAAERELKIKSSSISLPDVNKLIRDLFIRVNATTRIYEKPACKFKRSPRDNFRKQISEPAAFS